MIPVHRASGRRPTMGVERPGTRTTVGGRGFSPFGQPGNGPDATGGHVPGQTSGSGPKAELALGGFPGSGNRPGGDEESGSDGNSPDGFVWPSNTRNVGLRGHSGANSDRPGAGNDPGLGDGSGSVPNGSGGLSASSPTSGPGGAFSADGPPIGGSLSPATSRGAGSGAGLSGNPFGQPGESRGPSTGTMNVGQGGLGFGRQTAPGLARSIGFDRQSGRIARWWARGIGNGSGVRCRDGFGT